MYQLCQEFHCLPGDGGLKSQDSRDIWLLKIVGQAFAEKAERDRPKT